MNLSKVLEDSQRLIRKAGKHLQRQWGKSRSQLKGPDDLLTTADISTNEILIKGLKKIIPASSILSEEIPYTEKINENGYLWIIDPIDGTVNFANQIPFFSISVALLLNGESQLGLVYAPVNDELFHAQKNKGAFLNNKRLDLRIQETGLLSFIATSAGMIESDFSKKETSYHQRLLPHYNRLRLMGSQALHLCFVAAGRIEVALTNNAKIWDDAAAAFILQEAHGLYRHFNGKTIFPFSPDSEIYRGMSYASIGVNSQDHLARILKLING